MNLSRVGRFEQLDSLRGLAAISVVINHMLIIFPILPIEMPNYKGGSWFLNLITYTPLNIFWQGHSAVLLFFVLSGFVLSLPFLQQRGFSYPKFLIKRICRIYLPYVIAITSALLLRTWLATGPILGATTWFNQNWATPMTLGLVVQHYAFLGNYDTNAAIPAIWSLVHEMRISLIFPLMIILVIRLKWSTNIGVAVLISVLNRALGYLFWHHGLRSDIGWYDSMEYIPMFMFGGMLAKYRTELTSSYRQINTFAKILLLFVGVIAYTYDSLFMGNQILHLGDDWVLSLGSCIFIIIAFSSNTANRVLLTKPIRYLGKTSYSIYLWHEMILFGLVYTLHDIFPLWMIWVITLILTLAAAGLSYKLIELPFIRLGRYLTRERREKQHTNAIAT